MARIIALDYGGKRTGVAETDDAKVFAFGVKTIPTSTIWVFLNDYFKKNAVELLVIGNPKRLNNEATHATPLVHQFAKEFQIKYPATPIAFVDERFTSKMASQSMIEMGLKKKDRQNKEIVDEISATLILQSYLAQINR